MHLKKRDSESRLSAVIECIGSQSAALVSESAVSALFGLAVPKPLRQSPNCRKRRHVARLLFRTRRLPSHTPTRSGVSRACASHAHRRVDVNVQDNAPL